MKQKTFEAACLTAIRKQSGLTQAKFSRLLHVARGTYANYEAGRQRIPKDRMDDAISIARRYKIDPPINERTEQYG